MNPTAVSEPDTDAAVLSAVRQLLARVPDTAVIAVAYSGGVDSTVLLHATSRVAGPARCVACHVHHGLSSNADAWLAHGAAFAGNLGVSWAAEHVDLALRIGQGDSVEAAARDARYAALDALARTAGADLLLLGHHADDQAETVLLQLLRGAGLPGLAAMPALRGAAGRLPLARPFLKLLRATLDDYATRHALTWIDDESNADLRYARNALRSRVLPELAVGFPGYRDALARSARHAADAQVLLDELGALDLAAVVRSSQPAAEQPVGRHARRAPATAAKREPPLELDRPSAAPRAPERFAEPVTTALEPLILSRHALAALNERRAANLLRYWMRLCGMPAPSSARLGDWLLQLGAAHDGARLAIAHAGHLLRVYRDAVWWERDLGGSGDPSDPDDTDDWGNDGDADDSRGAMPTHGMPPPSPLRWNGDEIWHLPSWRGTLIFKPADIADPQSFDTAVLRRAPLEARARAGGERLRLQPGGASRSLKNLFQEAGVPAWRRTVPLIYLGDQLLFVPGLGIDRGVAPWPGASPVAAPAAAAGNGLAAQFAVLIWRDDQIIA